MLSILKYNFSENQSLDTNAIKYKREEQSDNFEQLYVNEKTSGKYKEPLAKLRLLKLIFEIASSEKSSWSAYDTFSALLTTRHLSEEEINTVIKETLDVKLEIS